MRSSELISHAEAIIHQARFRPSTRVPDMPQDQTAEYLVAHQVAEETQLKPQSPITQESRGPMPQGLQEDPYFVPEIRHYPTARTTRDVKLPSPPNKPITYY